MQEVPKMCEIDLTAENHARAEQYSRFIRYMLDNTPLKFDDIAWKYQKIADGATTDDLMRDMFRRRKK